MSDDRADGRIERVEDPLDESEWEPKPGNLRVTFDTKELMRRAGIPSDMSETADERYIEFLSQLARELPSEVRIRSTGYRYGPAAGDADTAFIDLVLAGANLVQGAHWLVSTLRWLRNAGAFDIRISYEAAKALGYWELERREMAGARLVSQELVRSTAGDAAKYEGFVLVFRLPDARLVTVELSIDGLLRRIVDGEALVATPPLMAGKEGLKHTIDNSGRTSQRPAAMARTGDTRYFNAQPVRPSTLAELGRRLGALYNGNVEFQVTRTSPSTAAEVAALGDLARERTKVDIAVDVPNTPTITIEGTEDTITVSVGFTSSEQADLTYALVRETLGLGDARRLTGPSPDADI